jgi:hypothetical protein
MKSKALAPVSVLALYVAEACGGSRARSDKNAAQALPLFFMECFLSV